MQHKMRVHQSAPLPTLTASTLHTHVHTYACVSTASVSSLTHLRIGRPLLPSTRSISLHTHAFVQSRPATRCAETASTWIGLFRSFVGLFCGNCRYKTLCLCRPYKVEAAWRGRREVAQVQREEASRRLASYCQRRSAWRAALDEQVCL